MEDLVYSKNKGYQQVFPELPAQFEVRIPANQLREQGDEICVLHNRKTGASRRLRFHDYESIYRIPGLYEALFYNRLKCNSPAHLCRLLTTQLRARSVGLSGLRVLDFGAGNGIMAEQLALNGVEEIFGLDILESAKEAAYRDRPGLYRDYWAINVLEAGDAPESSELPSHRFNCLTSVAALGFNDISKNAFKYVFNLLDSPAWLAFNIKEQFLNSGNAQGFGEFLDSLCRQGALEILASSRHLHRYSADGHPLYYVAIVGRKLAEVNH